MPIMHLLLLLCYQSLPADQVLDRYASFRQAHPNISVSYTATTQTGRVSGQALLSGGNRLYMAFKAPGLDYESVMTPQRGLELDRKEKLYDEFPGRPRIEFSESRLTGAIELFPGWILVKDLKTLLPKTANFFGSGVDTVNSIPCDRVTAKLQEERASTTMEFSIDKQGVIRRVKLDQVSQMGVRKIEWQVSQMAGLTPTDEKRFNLTIPVGFVPYALPEERGPLGIDETFPTSGWAATAGGSLDIKAKLGAKGGLVAILGEESDPSKASLASLKALKGAVPMVILSDAKRAVNGVDGYDASGATLSRVSPPSTPLFVLLDKDAKIVQMWMGYDAAKAKAFETSVRNGFAGKE